MGDRKGRERRELRYATKPNNKNEKNMTTT
jgi:hypothetical protein